MDHHSPPGAQTPAGYRDPVGHPSRSEGSVVEVLYQTHAEINPSIPDRTRLASGWLRPSGDHDDDLHADASSAAKYSLGSRGCERLETPLRRQDAQWMARTRLQANADRSLERRRRSD